MDVFSEKALESREASASTSGANTIGEVGPQGGETDAEQLKSLEKDLSVPQDAYLKPPSQESGQPKQSFESFDPRLSTQSNRFYEGVLTSPDDERSFTGRPRLSSRATQATTASGQTAGTGRSLPPLKRKETKLAQKEAHPWQHLGITLGLPMVLLFDVIVPCIIYYSWYRQQLKQWRADCADQYPNQSCPIEAPEFDKDIMGSAIASFGIGELWILLARVWRLYFRHDECAPLLSNKRWELDATSWVYLVAMIVALIPFLVGSTLVIPKLYLYGPSCLMAFLGILMTITTLHPFNIPVGINSHAKGSGLRPFIYYAAEDFIAVDGLQDREFRVRYNERYESNKMFRRFFRYLTLWWMFGVCVYIGCVSAVIWTLPFHIAFGLSLGVLFMYIATWAIVTVVWTNIEMKREHLAYEADEIEA